MNTAKLNLVRQAIQKRIDNGENYGANIIIAHKGKIVMRESFGQAEPNRPMQLDDVFLMMSVSKSFTALLTLKAVEQGWLSLDTRICEIYPEFAQNGKENITVFHILTHQAGLYGMPFMPTVPVDQMGDMNNIFVELCKMPADFKAGTKSSYSAIAGYTVLGKILEKCDPKQRPFAQIAQEELFEPLKMSHSQFGGTEGNPRLVPVSHTDKEKAKGDAMVGGLEKIEYMLNMQARPNYLIPAGNGYATVDDLFRFAESLRTKQTIISAELVDYATQNHCGDMDNETLKAECIKLGLEPIKAMFGLHGGYVRGTHNTLSMCGALASPNAFGGMGGGSTFYMVEPERELTVAFVSAGFIEGLAHLERVAELNDLIVQAFD